MRMIGNFILFLVSSYYAATVLGQQVADPSTMTSSSPANPIGHIAENDEVAKEWLKRIANVSTKSKNRPEVLVALLVNQLRALPRDRREAEQKVIATSMPSENIEYQSVLSQAFVRLFLEDRDANKIAAVIAERCPRYVGNQPIELTFVHSDIENPIRILINGFGKSVDDDNRRLIVSIVRDAFPTKDLNSLPRQPFVPENFPPVTPEDMTFMENCASWLDDNKDRAIINPEYIWNSPSHAPTARHVGLYIIPVSATTKPSP